VVIVNQFGFDKIASQGITAPVYFFCAVVYLVGALVSMRYDVRYKVLIVLSVPTMVGYAVLIGNPTSIAGRLIACFLAGSGIYINVGLHVTWLGQNIAGFRKRSTSVGMQQTIGNIGGVVAGQIYRTQDKPGYRLGHAVSLACWVGAMIGMTVEYFIWRKRNAERAVMTEEKKALIDDKGITGDHHYSYVYSL
jgi:MFS family permease